MADIREIGNKYFTSVKQGRKLVKLGINPDTANLHWSVDGHNSGKVIDGEYRLCFGPGCWNSDGKSPAEVPCWSLSDLLKQFPVKFMNESGLSVPAKPWVTIASDGEPACCQYGYLSRSGADPIDAAFNMLVEALEYLK